MSKKQPIQKQIRVSTCFDGFHTYVQGVLIKLRTPDHIWFLVEMYTSLEYDQKMKSNEIVQ